MGEIDASSTITAVVNKDAGEKAGVALQKRGNSIFITKLSPNGVLANSDLRDGMELLTINNVDFSNNSGKSSEDAAKLLMETQGTLTVVARKPPLPPGTLITANVQKDSPEQSVGVSLKSRSGSGKGAVITSLKPDGLAFKTDLQAGMIIKTINNKDCSNITPVDAANIFKETTGLITILAEVPPAATAAAAATGAKSSTAGPRPPPHGIKEGGTWITKAHAGNQTMLWVIFGCFCFGIFGVCPLLCPCDERLVYVVDGKGYTSDGEYIGPHTIQNK